MKKSLIVLLFILIPALSFGQFKEQAEVPSFSQIVGKPANNLILGFLNSDKIDMNHSFSMGYYGLGGNGMMVNTYTNTINYRVSDPLLLRFNVGIMNTPYNSFNNSVNTSALDNTQFFGGAELFYRPTENSMVKVGVNISPGYYGPGYYNNYNNWLGYGR